MSTYSPLQKLRIKDMQNILSVSRNSAINYLKDIKEHYSIELVTYQHLCHYLKIPKES